MPLPSHIILASRSPRRLELLQQIVPAERIQILPPRSADELGFDGLTTWPAIEARLVAIARHKAADVLEQLTQNPSIFNLQFAIDNLQFPEHQSPQAIILAADTVIVVTNQAGDKVVLGQPPDDESWQEVVRGWFREYYFGKTHIAATALSLVPLTEEGEPQAIKRVERVVTTEVTFVADGEQWLDWYLSTDEPRGKAGGYAIQGAGSVFVERVVGSLSNVVGLPLRETLELLDVARDQQPGYSE